MGAMDRTREAGRRLGVGEGSGVSIPSTMVASGSTNVACESNDESGICGSGAESELELSPLAGTPMPPCLGAFPRPWGYRGSLFCIFAWLGRNLNRRTALQGDRILTSISHLRLSALGLLIFSIPSIIIAALLWEFAFSHSVSGWARVFAGPCSSF